MQHLIVMLLNWGREVRAGIHTDTQLSYIDNNTSSWRVSIKFCAWLSTVPLLITTANGVQLHCFITWSHPGDTRLDDLKEKLKLLSDEVNSIKTDLKLALQQTHAQMKSSSGLPCLSNTCVHSNTLNMQLEWYPSSCNDITTMGVWIMMRCWKGTTSSNRMHQKLQEKYIKCTQ